MVVSCLSEHWEPSSGLLEEQQVPPSHLQPTALQFIMVVLAGVFSPLSLSFPETIATTGCSEHLLKFQIPGTQSLLTELGTTEP